MGKHLQELLMSSFDEALNEAERQELSRALAESENLSKEKEKLEQIRALVSKNQASYRPYFASRVMNRLENLKHAGSFENDESQYLSLAFNRLAVSGALAIILLLGITYFTTGSLSLDAILGISDLSTEHLGYLSLYDY